MSDTGWQWVGPKPEPPPDPGPEPKPANPKRWVVWLTVLLGFVVTIACLIQPLHLFHLRPETTIPEAAAAAAPDALAPAEPAAAPAPDESNSPGRELPRLRGEIVRLRAENEALQKRIADLEAAAAASREVANSVVNLQVRSFQLNVNAVNALTARPEGSTEYREFAAMEALRRTFSAAGVELNAPKSIYYNAATGKLMVRATERDLTLIEQTIVANGLQ
ncbi:MAG: hypothetical protein EPO07_18555 [Verrucomicrobia bacterium]|nr:MAG: hypothetical protein EPO07_18555 [Verrucomicrobiota bacterium]